MAHTNPLPLNELERITRLSEFDLDYTNLEDNFKDLTLLAARVSGTEVSLVNLIDSFTQWTISSHGLELNQMMREDSVCQYTIIEEDSFEVKNLAEDERFKDKFYVKDDPNLKYYYGIPLKTGMGIHIGALCVLDPQTKELSPEKIELLKIIANEVVNRLKAFKVIGQLQTSVKEVNETKKRLAHDIRGPLAGIIGLTEIIAEQGDNNKLDDILEFVSLIRKSSASILELANEILTAEASLDKAPELKADEYNQLLLKEKLEKLYRPQALSKNIQFTVSTNADTEVIPFSKNKLLQIVGNLISNAIKFTPERGTVSVDLRLRIGSHSNDLFITVKDNGIGISMENIERILLGQSDSTDGTGGEAGFGFGLPLARHLIESLSGTLSISSEIGKGTIFSVQLPQFKKN